MAIEFLCNIWKVQHGSAAFVRTPNNRFIAFDAGCSDDFSPSAYLSTEHSLTSLDNLIISHPHADHIQDLPTLLLLTPPRVRYRNPSIPNHLVFPSGRDALTEPLKSWDFMERDYVNDVSQGDDLADQSNFGRVEFSFYWNIPAYLTEGARDNINNYSLLTVCSYRDVTIVFPGDLEPAGWEAMMNNTNLESIIGKGNHRFLVAPHHGRRSGVRNGDGSVYTRFLTAMQPHLTIISDKHGNDSTDPEAYRPLSIGFPVNTAGYFEKKHVLTTKTNKCVSIQIENNTTYVKAF